MIRFRWIVSVCALAAFGPGCGGSGDTLPRQAVTGMVTYDGQPLKEGRINFTPSDPNAKDPVFGGAPIKDGKYTIDKEVGLVPGVLDELGDPAGANQAYLGVVSTYAAFHDWVTQAWERYLPNSLKDINAMELTDPLTTALKRKRELTLYKLCVKNLYQWQALDEKTDSPSGALTRLRRRVPELKAELNVTPVEEAEILRELGIAPAK